MPAALAAFPPVSFCFRGGHGHTPFAFRPAQFLQGPVPVVSDPLCNLGVVALIELRWHYRISLKSSVRCQDCIECVVVVVVVVVLVLPDAHNCNDVELGRLQPLRSH